MDSHAPGSVHDGTSWATACLTIQTGLRYIASGDEVWVAKGTYNVVNQSLLVPLALYGGFAGTETAREQRDWKANTTVLQGSVVGGALVTTGKGLLLDGFTIRSNNDGVTVNGGSITLAHNTIAGSPASTYYTNGVYVAGNASATLVGNSITGFTRGVWIYGTTTLVDNTLSGNGFGVYYAGDGPVTLTNNTITGNGSGVYLAGASVTDLVNNIIAFNSSYGVNKASRIGVFSHNDVYGNGRFDYYAEFTGYTPPADQGNISVDPMLSNLYHDAHIQPGSPCVDAGDDSVVGPGAADINGHPRIIGDHVDIGADECDGKAWTVPAVVWHVATDGDDSHDGLTWATAKKTVDAALAAAQGTDEVWVARGSYQGPYKPGAGVALYGGFLGTETQRGQRDWTANPTVLYGSNATGYFGVVDCEFADAVVDGFTLKGNSATSDVYVIVGGVTLANSTLVGTVSFGAFIYSGKAILVGNTISGLSSSAVDLERDTGAELSRNTISGNSGGIFSAGLITLTDNVVSANTKAGVSIGNADRVSGNLIAGNGGTGLALRGRATVMNNVICNNTGDGISAAPAQATIANNTVAGNNNGVSVTGYSTVHLANNIIAFNNAWGVTNGSPANAILSSSHDDVYANPSGSDVEAVSVDPLFVDRANGDFHLQAGSPCIDAGDDAWFTPGEIDRDGGPRRLGAHEDMGAFEFPTPGFFTLADAAKCLKIASGMAAFTPEDTTRLGADSANPRLDLRDALRLARKAAGLDANP